MNKIIITGNLTADPVSRTTQAGASVCNFTVAVNRRGNDRDTADFFVVQAWRGLGEICQKYLAKGRKVMVEGEIHVRDYTTNNGEKRQALDVVADNVEFLSAVTPNNASAPVQQNAQQAAPKRQAPAPAYTATTVDDDELPF